MDVKHPISEKVFKFCGFEPYQRKDGEWTELKVWESTCNICQKPFISKTTKGVKSFMDSKVFQLVHCEEHRGMKWQR
jgi:hypothetical protein